MTTVLFVRPDWDDLAMRYAQNWLSYGVDEAKSRGFNVIDLYGADATKEKIFDTIQTVKPEVCIFTGHGNSDTYTAQELEVVFKACSGDEIMNGTISHFLSCSVGQLLLPDMISKGAVATIGYQEDFQFIVNTDYSVDEDPYAEPFRDVTVTIIRAVLDGKTLKEVWDAGIAKCNEWIQKLWDKTGTDWAEVISCLEHDRDCMIALGEKEAYVLPPVTRMAISPQQLLGLGLIFLFLTSKS